MRTMFLVFIVLFWSIPVPAMESSEELLGLKFPILLTDPTAWVLPSDTVFGTTYSVEVMVRLFLGADGRIDSIDYDTNVRPDFVRGVKNSLKSLQFEPAKIMGQAIPVELPVFVTFNSSGYLRRVGLTLPYDAISGGRDRKLIDRMLIDNGFTLPGLEYFPSYYLNIPRDSGRAGYDYAIFRVSLDRDGGDADMEIISTSNEKLADIFSITARYARFRRAGYREESFPAEIYLIARFFDKVHYPTAAWPHDSLSAKNIYLDRFRLETVLYLDSLVGPAYPENISGTFGFPRMTVEKDSIPVSVNITADGRIEWALYEKQLSAKSKEDLNRVLKLIKFIPAIDTSGHAVPYVGRLLIVRAGSSNKLRIIANWLD